MALLRGARRSEVGIRGRHPGRPGHDRRKYGACRWTRWSASTIPKVRQLLNNSTPHTFRRSHHSMGNLCHSNCLRQHHDAARTPCPYRCGPSIDGLHAGRLRPIAQMPGLRPVRRSSLCLPTKKAATQSVHNKAQFFVRFPCPKTRPLFCGVQSGNSTQSGPWTVDHRQPQKIRECERAHVAPISTNTALPLSNGEIVFREQWVVARSSDSVAGARRELDRLEARSVLGYGLTPRMAVFGVLPIVDIHRKFFGTKS